MSDTPKINLTLEPAEVAVPVPAEVILTTGTEVAPVEESIPKELDDSTLTEEEKAMVATFSKQIDLTNTNQVLQYGASAQKNISAFSDTTLGKMKTQDMGKVGESLTSLVNQLKGFDIENEKPKGISGWFKKSGNKMSQMMTKYETVEKNIDHIVDVLQDHQIQLMKDIAMLDQMYEVNLTYFKELTMYILAGKKRLEEALAKELPALQEQAKQSGKPEDAHRANDFSALCNRFDKKLHDLELTRTISIQMAPQIRMIQNNDSQMVEKIQSSLVNTIPLWKNQMVLALGIAHGQEALQSQRAVTNMTNELLRKNAETLKQGTVETAKEAERAIVDIETLRYTNEQLISTLDEVLQIQEDGRQKRRQAEQEIRQIEEQLRGKLLEFRS